MNGKRLPNAFDPMDLEARAGTSYPAPHDRAVRGRIKRALTEPLGLSQFAANFVTLEPGAMSAQRHWHHHEDEFVFVVRGPITQVTEAGRRELKEGMVAGYPAGVPDGHHLINESDHPVSFLVVGSRYDEEIAEYPDLDLRGEKRDGRFRFTTRDGRPLSPTE